MVHLVADTCRAPGLSCKLHAVLILLTRDQSTIVRKRLQTQPSMKGPA